MAGNDKSKSLNQAKVWQWEPATRVEPPVAPAPRNYCGLKREDPASLKSSWQRIDDGENVAPNAYTATYLIGNGTLPPPKNSRRRCYTEEEKAQVAMTRKRGACGKCRTSRTKCNHESSAPPSVVPSPAPSPAATDQYQMQSESHEIFALGLTTSSLTANKDGHKQVIKETIAAIDDKLVNAQNNPVGQNQEASKEASPKVQVRVSPPEPTISKESSGQQRAPSARVHHVKAPPTLSTTFQDSVNTFRVFDGRKPRQAKKSQQPKANSVNTNQFPLRMKNPNLGKAPNGTISSSVIKKPYNEHSTMKRSNPPRMGNLATPKIIQPVCEVIQSSATNRHLSVPSALPFQSKHGRGLSPGTPKNKDTQTTMARFGNPTSPRRPASPMSEGTSSNPRSFVSLPELSLGHSLSSDQDPERPLTTLLDHQIDEQSSGVALDMLMLGIESFSNKDFQGSYTDLLNAEISHVASNDSGYTYMAAPQSDDVSLLANAMPEICFNDFMELD